MEISELKCFKLSNGFSSIGTDTSSLDNDFAVITRTGVHVMSIIPNLTSKDDQIRIQRFHIKTPEIYLQPDISIDMKSMNQEKFCILNLNSKLIPITDRYQTSATYVKQIGFINFHHESSPKSLLGILTNHGCLQLFTRNKYGWKSAIDISNLWKEYWLSTRVEEEPVDFDSLVKRFRNIRLVSFVNAESFRIDDHEKYWLLICVNDVGVVSFWKMNQYIEQGAPSLINTQQLGLVIHTLYWHSINDREGWLITTSTDGIVKMYTCSKNESGEMILVLLKNIWEDADSIHVLNFKIKRLKERHFMAFSKENTIFVYLFNDKMLNYRFEFKQKIVGIEITDDSQIFVTLLNREIFTLTVDNGTCECSPVSFKTITNIQHHKIWGLSFSKNGAFCVLSCSISCHFDHLCMKEPWYVLFCSTQKLITQSMMLKLNNDSSFYDAYDCLELFRLSLVKSGSNFDASDLSSLWNSLNQEIGVCRKNFQTMYILSRCYPFCEDTKNVIAIEIAFVVCNFLYFSDKLSDIKKQYYFYQWLSSNISKLPESLLGKRHIKDVSQRMTNFMEYCADEKCELCGSDISNHSNLKLIVCEKQHKLLRCSFGFLPVTQSYTECSLCHSVQLKSEGLTRCVICDNKILT